MKALLDQQMDWMERKLSLLKTNYPLADETLRARIHIQLLVDKKSVTRTAERLNEIVVEELERIFGPSPISMKERGKFVS